MEISLWVIYCKSSPIAAEPLPLGKWSVKIFEGDGYKYLKIKLNVSKRTQRCSKTRVLVGNLKPLKSQER